MCLKRVEKKKLLGRHNKEISLNTFFKKMQKQPLDVFCKKTIVKKLAIITEKHTPLLEFLFNSKYCEIFKGSYFEEHLRTAASENVFMKPYDETEKK